MKRFTYQAWVEMGTTWGNRREYLIGYKIYYNDSLAYTCKGYNQDEAEKLTKYLNQAFELGYLSAVKKQNDERMGRK